MANVVIYSTSSCPYCVAAKTLFSNLKVAYEEVNLDNDPNLRVKLSHENNGWRTVPMIFIDKKFMGGYDDISALHKKGELTKLLGL